MKHIERVWEKFGHFQDTTNLMEHRLSDLGYIWVGVINKVWIDIGYKLDFETELEYDEYLRSKEFL